LISSRLAKRYAKALLSIGQEDGNYQLYGEGLKEFAKFCSENREFFKVVSTRIFSMDERRQVLEIVLERSVFPVVVKNFLRVLLEKDRIVAIEDISRIYEMLTDEISNITRASIITARPLKGDAMAKLEQALERLTGKKVKTQVNEDPSLIGGVVVKIGDMVLDGSVRAQLEGLKESLKRGG